MKKEIWKPIRHHCRYQVSNFGRIRNGKRICRQWFSRGHWFCKVGGRDRRVSRLVAAAFMGLRRSQWVKLKRGTSPRLGNLIVCGRGQRWTAKLTPAKVLAIYRSTDSAATLARRHKCSRRTVYSIKNLERWTWLLRRKAP